MGPGETILTQSASRTTIGNQNGRLNRMQVTSSARFQRGIPSAPPVQNPLAHPRTCATDDCRSSQRCRQVVLIHSGRFAEQRQAKLWVWRTIVPGLEPGWGSHRLYAYFVRLRNSQRDHVTLGKRSNDHELGALRKISGFAASHWIFL